jgi:hypothetical protein
MRVIELAAALASDGAILDAWRYDLSEPRLPHYLSDADRRLSVPYHPKLLKRTWYDTLIGCDPPFGAYLTLAANPRDAWSQAAMAALLERVKALGVDLDQRLNPSTGRTLLHAVAGAGSLEMIGLLVDAGVDTDLRCRQGSTALQYAQECDRDEAVIRISTHASRDRVRGVMARTLASRRTP